MAAAPVTVFLGARTVRVPWAVLIAALALVALGVLAALANAVLPALAGIAPVLPLPGLLQGAANLVAYAVALAGLLAAILWLFGQGEAVLARRHDRGPASLVPLAGIAAQALTLAPNRTPEDRSRSLQALDTLAARGDLTAVLAVVDPEDAEDGSVDRFLVTTATRGTRVRHLLHSVGCDGVTRVPAAERARYVRLGAPGSGTMWLLVWD